MNNRDVCRAWRIGLRGRNSRGTLRSDGYKLYSYNLIIGEFVDGQPFVYNYTARSRPDGLGGEHEIPPLGFVSMTTSNHVSVASRYAPLRFKPPS